MLVNPITKNNVDLYLENPFQTLILVGPVGSGKKQIIDYISNSLFGAPIDEYHHTYLIDGGVDGIDRVREVKKHLTHSFVSSDPKQKRIVALLDIDSLSREALVSLLKLVEEPPEHTLIVMTVGDTSSVPKTVFSRSKSINVLPVDLDQATSFLTKQGYSEQDIKTIWYKSRGLAGRITDQNSVEDEEDTNLTAKQFITKKPSERLILVNELSKMDKIRQIEIIRSINGILYYKLGQLTRDNGESLGLVNKIEKLNILTTKLEANTNPKLIWTELSLSL